MILPTLYEYLPLETALAITKLAEQKEIKRPLLYGLGTVGKGLVGFSGGTLVGFGLGHVADKVYTASTGKKLPKGLLVPAASLLGAGMGLAYSMYKAKELQELQRAVQAHRDKSARSVPSK